ncbi:DUF418 domain-containing protein [Bacillus sp. JJ722]|uniref:DUF418 domain-containing protein n=1 Tax=Bacillus sp. JJ722 TaxID=3122973 RepID=UPI0030005137
MKRIRLLDILRGFAIIGTLGTNIWVFAAVTNENNDYFTGATDWWLNMDDFISSLFLFLVNGKFLSMLTIMFGIGLEIKRQQAIRNDWTWPGIYIWGSFLLFIDGILHYVFVIEVDVLMSYGVTAIIVAYIAKLPHKKMMRWFYAMGTFHLFNITALTVILLGADTNFSITSASQVYASGTWIEQVWYRIENIGVLRTEAIFIIPQNICLFIIGILLMRKKIFTLDSGINVKTRNKFLTIGFIAIPLNLLYFLPSEALFFPVRYVFAPLMALFYMGLFSWLFEKYKQSRLFYFFEKIGKMALSNYMLQNIVASCIFYGWGLGIGLQELSAPAIISIWLLIVLFMMAFSHFWLRHFSAGPIEWAWKLLTNIPARKRKQSPKMNVNS